MDSVKLDGLDDLQSQFSALPQRLQQNILRTAVRKAANVIRDQAKANFGIGDGPNEITGALRNSIRTSEGRGSQSLVVYYVTAGTLTPSQRKKMGVYSPYYALWVEMGHINRKAGEALRGSKEHKAHQRSISTSNTPPHPYMRPAFEQMSTAALDVISNEIQSRIEEILS